MTVLQRKEAGFDLGQLIRIAVGAVLASVIAAGVILAITNDSPAPASSPAAQAEAAQADVLHLQYQDRYFAELDKLNKADIGVGAVSTTAPFLAGSTAQTHTGRVSPVVEPVESVDRADLIHYQKAAELTDPADFKFKN